MPRAYDPFDLDRPALVAFSGGRTSAYMLRRILDSFGGRLPEDVRVVFCNTGKEREETLHFVQECSLVWGVPVIWLEYRYTPEREGHGEGRATGKHSFEEVRYPFVSGLIPGTDGRPFNEAIRARGYPPNRMARFCTPELKVKTMWRWAQAQGLQSYTKAIGLRADEPARVDKVAGGMGETRSAEHIVCPLAEARVTLYDVMEFWAAQPFGLQLRPEEGNCDLCFLKRKGVLLRLMEERPDLADWWVRQEAGGRLFRTPKDRPSYSALLQMARQPTLFGPPEDDDEDLPCACTD